MRARVSSRGKIKHGKRPCPTGTGRSAALPARSRLAALGGGGRVRPVERVEPPKVAVVVGEVLVVAVVRGGAVGQLVPRVRPEGGEQAEEREGGEGEIVRPHEQRAHVAGPRVGEDVLERVRVGGAQRGGRLPLVVDLVEARVPAAAVEASIS